MNPENAKSVLLEIKTIFDQSNVKFWLRRGVLLGAVRESRFIPYDHDIDISIIAEDWNPSMAGQFKKQGFAYKERRYYQNLITTVILQKLGIGTAIVFEYLYPPENSFIHLCRNPDDCCAITPTKFLVNDFFIEFLGETFRIPFAVEEQLARIYGKDWKIPVEDKKDFDKHRKLISLDKYLQWFKQHSKPEWLKQ